MAEKTQEVVNPGEYLITRNPLNSLYTKGIDSCVGLALIEKQKDSLKRGLIHSLYDGLANFDFSNTTNQLQKFLNEFDPKKSKAILCYNPFEAGDTNRLAEILRNKLISTNFPIFYICNRSNINQVPIYLKEMYLHSEKLYISHRTRDNSQLNFITLSLT
jgi:hypothetical protein